MQACFQVATLTKNQDSAAGGGEDRDRLGSQQGLLSLHTRSPPACMLDNPHHTRRVSPLLGHSLFSPAYHSVF